MQRLVITRLAPIAAALLLLAATASTAHGYERAGWFAQLQTYHHDVSGTVTIIDADTYRVDDFTYDGGGPAVYFYLGASTSNDDLQSGLSTGPLLSGTVYDGTTPLVIDLPPGHTLDGYNAVSVWCEDFYVDFGSGTFVVPEPSALALLSISGMLLLRRRRIR